MNTEHHYSVELEWTGNRGTGTSGYKAYGRDHIVRSNGKHDIEGSSDKTFYGDHDRWNPEELLLVALSQCHLLSYLHVAAAHGVQVVGYTDSAVGTMETSSDGGGRFTSVTLKPVVTVADSGVRELADSLHHEASQKCFIAASVNFPVRHETAVYAQV